MKRDKAVEIIEDMLDRFSDDGVFVYNVEEDAIRELISAARQLDDLFGGNPPKF